MDSQFNNQLLDRLIVNTTISFCMCGDSVASIIAIFVSTPFNYGNKYPQLHHIRRRHSPLLTLVNPFKPKLLYPCFPPTLLLEEMGAAASSVTQKSIHEFTVKDYKGKEVDFSTYKGKVLLVVNVASNCGFTNKNYTQLTELYTKYKDRGFEILAFPCNQFLEQEPGTSEDAKEFACTRFKAEYPVFQKVKVNGQGTVPVYKFLKASKVGYFGSSIKWNFTKFLINKEGQVVHRYSTNTPPLSIESDIQKELGYM